TTTGYGDVDLAKWPEMTFQVRSRVSFPRGREIFFKSEPWVLSGDSDFAGTFHLFKHGHELTGHFASDVVGIYEYQLPALRGSLRWTPTSFEVWNGASRFSGGNAAFSYSIKQIGQKGVRPVQRFEASVMNADLATFTDFRKMPGLRFAGSASGHYRLEWTSGHFSEHRGDGDIEVTPPPGAVLMTAALPAGHRERERGPFAPQPLPPPVPVARALDLPLPP